MTNAYIHMTHIPVVGGPREQKVPTKRIVIFFWLHWVFVAAVGALVVNGAAFVAVHMPLAAVASLVAD